MATQELLIRDNPGKTAIRSEYAGAFGVVDQFDPIPVVGAAAMPIGAGCPISSDTP